MTTRCVCGAVFTAPAIDEAWRLFDEHVDQHHGRRFPKQTYGSVAYNPQPRRRRKAPLTHQGGEG